MPCRAQTHTLICANVLYIPINAHVLTACVHVGMREPHGLHIERVLLHTTSRFEVNMSAARSYISALHALVIASIIALHTLIITSIRPAFACTHPPKHHCTACTHHHNHHCTACTHHHTHHCIHSSSQTSLHCTHSIQHRD